MAAKRMFANSIIDSDGFCTLSEKAQLLYFHLGMKADDDGFVPIKRICIILGFDEKPLHELIENGFLIPFDNGVVVIVHWFVNNTLKIDRYHETRYTSLKKQLCLNENNEYSIMEPSRNRDGTNTEESLAQRSPAHGNEAYGNEAHGIAEEGSPEGGNRAINQICDVVQNQGVRINERVTSVLLEELSKGNVETVCSKIIAEPNFLQRLKLLGRTP